GRLGGEEFAAVLANVGRDDAVALAESIHQRFVEAAADVDGYSIGATVSIGVVLSQDTTLDIPELLAQADQALYYAQESGRNRVEARPSTICTSARMHPHRAWSLRKARLDLLRAESYR